MLSRTIIGKSSEVPDGRKKSSRLGTQFDFYQSLMNQCIFHNRVQKEEFNGNIPKVIFLSFLFNTLWDFCCCRCASSGGICWDSRRAVKSQRRVTSIIVKVVPPQNQLLAETVRDWDTVGGRSREENGRCWDCFEFNPASRSHLVPSSLQSFLSTFLVPHFKLNKKKKGNMSIL